MILSTNIQRLFTLILVLPGVWACQAPSVTPLSSAPIAAMVRSADGVPIRYQVQGNAAPTLVFVHGWSCDRSYWDAQVSHFASQYRVVTVDLAGHGKSGTTRSRWTMEAFGKDVAAVVEQLELEHVILIGHSMGGPVVLEAAQRIPARLLGVVGVEIFHDMEKSIIPPDQIDSFLAPFRKDFIEATRSFVRTMFVETSDSKVIERIALDMSSAPPEVAIGAFEEILPLPPAHFQRMISDLPVPFVLINSSEWIPTNLEAAQRYGVEVLLMDGVGHFVMIEDPATFNRLLEQAFAKFMGQERAAIRRSGFCQARPGFFGQNRCMVPGGPGHPKRPGGLGAAAVQNA